MVQVGADGQTHLDHQREPRLDANVHQPQLRVEKVVAKAEPLPLGDLGRIQEVSRVVPGQEYVRGRHQRVQGRVARLAHGVTEIEHIVLGQPETIGQHGDLQPLVADGVVRPSDRDPVGTVYAGVVGSAAGS